MRNRRSTIGMDVWESTTSMKQLYRLVKERNWQLYELFEQQDRICFCAPIVLRRDIHQFLPNAQLIKTTGMIGFLLRQMRMPQRILCILCAITLWFGLSHTIFAIQLYGDHEESKQLILRTLTEMGYQIPFYAHDMQGMKAELRKRLENDIAWLEVSRQGSRYEIHFTTKEFAQLEELSQNELVAQKDGVIEHFEVQHGNKLVAINDFVHAGDVLVSNVLTDSKNEEQPLYVKGCVYAYTWREVHVEAPKTKMPKPFVFYQLLFEARREASKDLREKESIYKENILQFQDNAGTISMDIHYTLIEDITTPR